MGVFLESLPKSILDRLYVQPATCLALLRYSFTLADESTNQNLKMNNGLMGGIRMLPDFAKHIVLRLLYVKEPVHDVIINSWTLPENSK